MDNHDEDEDSEDERQYSEYLDKILEENEVTTRHARNNPSLGEMLLGVAGSTQSNELNNDQVDGREFLGVSDAFGLGPPHFTTSLSSGHYPTTSGSSFTTNFGRYSFSPDQALRVTTSSNQRSSFQRASSWLERQPRIDASVQVSEIESAAAASTSSSEAPVSTTTTETSMSSENAFREASQLCEELLNSIATYSKRITEIKQENLNFSNGAAISDILAQFTMSETFTRQNRRGGGDDRGSGSTRAGREPRHESSGDEWEDYDYNEWDANTTMRNFSQQRFSLVSDSDDDERAAVSPLRRSSDPGPVPTSIRQSARTDTERGRRRISPETREFYRSIGLHPNDSPSTHSDFILMPENPKPIGIPSDLSNADIPPPLEWNCHEIKLVSADGKVSADKNLICGGAGAGLQMKAKKEETLEFHLSSQGGYSSETAIEPVTPAEEDGYCSALMRHAAHLESGLNSLRDDIQNSVLLPKDEYEKLITRRRFRFGLGGICDCISGCLKRGSGSSGSKKTSCSKKDEFNPEPRFPWQAPTETTPSLRYDSNLSLCFYTPETTPSYFQ